MGGFHVEGGQGFGRLMKINHRLPALTICIINVLSIKPSPSNEDCMFQKVYLPPMDFEKGMFLKH